MLFLPRLTVFLGLTSSITSASITARCSLHVMDAFFIPAAAALKEQKIIKSKMEKGHGTHNHHGFDRHRS